MKRGTIWNHLTLWGMAVGSTDTGWVLYWAKAGLSDINEFDKLIF